MPTYGGVPTAQNSGLIPINAPRAAPSASATATAVPKTTGLKPLNPTPISASYGSTAQSALPPVPAAQPTAQSAAAQQPATKAPPPPTNPVPGTTPTGTEKMAGPPPPIPQPPGLPQGDNTSGTDLSHVFQSPNPAIPGYGNSQQWMQQQAGYLSPYGPTPVTQTPTFSAPARINATPIIDYAPPPPGGSNSGGSTTTTSGTTSNPPPGGGASGGTGYVPVSGGAIPGMPGSGLADGTLSTYTADNNLIDKQINPVPSDRLRALGGLVDTAAGNVGGADLAGAVSKYGDLYSQLFGTGQVAYNPVNTTVNAGPAVNVQNSDLLNHLTSLMTGAADKIGSGPDRFQLAQNTFDTYANATDPAYQKALRDATKLATSSGGLGSGMLSNEYGTEAENRALALDTMRRSTYNDALSQSIQDRLNNLGAFSGLESQQAAQEAAQRGEQRTERQYGTDVATGNVGRGMQERDFATTVAEQNAQNDFARKEAAAQMGLGTASTLNSSRLANLSALLGAEGQVSGEERANRGETAQQQGFQAGQANTAAEQAMEAERLALQAQGQQFGEGLSAANLGYQNDPYFAYLNAAGQYGNDASSAWNAMGQANAAGNQNNSTAQIYQQILKMLMGGGGGGGGGTGGTQVPDYTVA